MSIVLGRFIPFLVLAFLSHLVLAQGTPTTIHSASEANQLLNQLLQRAPKDGSTPELVKQILKSTDIKANDKLNPQLEFDLQKGVIKHPDWLLGDELYRAAKANQKEMFAALLPRLTGTVDYGERQVGSNPIIRTQKYDYTAATTQLNLKQLVYDFGASWDLWKSSDIRSKAVAERVKVSRSELVLQAMTAALEEQRALLHLSWTSVLMLERQKYLDKINERFEIGAGTIYDVARAKAKLAEATSSNRFNQQKHQSARLLKSQYGLPEEFRLPPLVVNLKQIRQDLDTHPVLREARYYLDSAQLEASANSAMALPRISLEANTSRRDIAGYNYPMNDSSVLLTMTYNFMTGGAEGAKKDQAVARLGQARADYESRMLKMRVELDRSLNEYQAHLTSMRDARELLESFTGMYLAQKELFQLQRGSLTELANTEDDLSQATKNYINAWIDYSVSAYRLHHTNGTLLSLVGLYTTVGD